MHRKQDTHCPDGLASTVDFVPGVLRLDAAPNQLLGYRAFGFPLFELNSAQPASNMRIQATQCSFDLDRADSE